MKTLDEIELRTAPDTPELHRLAEAWRQAAMACNATALDIAEDALRALSTPARTVPMDEWRRLDAACGGSGGCLMPAAGLPAGTLYVCLPATTD